MHHLTGTMTMADPPSGSAGRRRNNSRVCRWNPVMNVALSVSLTSTKTGTGIAEL